MRQLPTWASVDICHCSVFKALRKEHLRVDDQGDKLRGCSSAIAASS
jgi:hypothetical protein